MDTNKILHADVLDIIFDNRNKAYGAYELRKNYNKRLKRSMVIAATLMLVTVSAPMIASMFEKPIVIDKPQKKVYDVTEVVLPKDPIIEPIKKHVEPITKDVSTVINTIPEIVEAVKMREEDKMPTKEDLENAVSGLDNHKGTTENPSLIVPDGHEGTVGEIEIPTNGTVEEDITYETTEITQEPEFPGGEGELLNYLAKNIQYPKNAVDGDVEGKVVLGFVVNKEGEIEGVKVVRALGYGCDEEAVKVVNKMPKWKPGKNNGRSVKVYFNLPIDFELVK